MTWSMPCPAPRRWPVASPSAWRERQPCTGSARFAALRAICSRSRRSPAPLRSLRRRPAIRRCGIARSRHGSLIGSRGARPLVCRSCAGCVACAATRDRNPRGRYASHRRRRAMPRHRNRRSRQVPRRPPPAREAIVDRCQQRTHPICEAELPALASHANAWPGDRRAGAPRVCAAGPPVEAAPQRCAASGRHCLVDVATEQCLSSNFRARFPCAGRGRGGRG